MIRGCGRDARFGGGQLLVGGLQRRRMRYLLVCPWLQGRWGVAVETRESRAGPHATSALAAELVEASCGTREHRGPSRRRGRERVSQMGSPVNGSPFAVQRCPMAPIQGGRDQARTTRGAAVLFSQRSPDERRSVEQRTSDKDTGRGPEARPTRTGKEPAGGRIRRRERCGWIDEWARRNRVAEYGVRGTPVVDEMETGATEGEGVWWGGKELAGKRKVARGGLVVYEGLRRQRVLGLNDVDGVAFGDPRCRCFAGGWCEQSGRNERRPGT